MKILELFAGTGSISSTFEKAGHEAFRVDFDRQHQGIDWYADVGTITAADILERFGKPEVIWCSPDCKTYSVAAISRHRRKEADGNLTPITQYAAYCDDVNQHMLKLIEELKPTFFFIENPRGGFRKMKWIQHIPRFTVTYCKFGEKRMKPTDIFSNHPAPGFPEPCKQGEPCHEAAPRGSRTGTQSTQNSVLKAKIPDLLCEHILKICEAGMGDNKDAASL
jgi:hypothetical protein